MTKTDISAAVHWPIRFFAFGIFVAVSAGLHGAEYPAPRESDYIIRNFKFASGETTPELRIHYRTLGKGEKDEQGKTRNAVLIMHGTTGSGAQFIRPEFAGELFGKDQPLDATKFFILLPDGIGHGKSSKPSDGMHAKFPRYGYREMVEAQFRLLTDGLGVNHARLVMGTSMGGMHTWLWGELHPDFMDALMPLASLPTQISGRNRAWRRIVIDAIRNDPAWNGGEYKTQPPSLRTAAQMLWFMTAIRFCGKKMRRASRKRMKSSTSLWRTSSKRMTRTMCCMHWKRRTITIRGRTSKKFAHRCSRSIPLTI